VPARAPVRSRRPGSAGVPMTGIRGTPADTDPDPDPGRHHPCPARPGGRGSRGGAAEAPCQCGLGGPQPAAWAIMWAVTVRARYGAASAHL
jgi:hypothetical protein